MIPEISSSTDNFFLSGSPAVVPSTHIGLDEVQLTVPAALNPIKCPYVVCVSQRQLTHRTVKGDPVDLSVSLNNEKALIVDSGP